MKHIVVSFISLARTVNDLLEEHDLQKVHSLLEQDGITRNSHHVLTVKPPPSYYSYALPVSERLVLFG
jgi:hypothetical protein